MSTFRKNSVRILLLVVCIMHWEDLHAQKDTVPNRFLRPDYLNTQFAGNMGLLSIGAGFQWKSIGYDLTLLYGYVPKQFSTREVHTFALRNTFSLSKRGQNPLHTFRTHAGLGILFETGNHSSWTLPDVFPEGYYFTNSLHVSLYLGTSYAYRGWQFRKVELYAEVGTLGRYLYYFVKSPTIDAAHVFNLSTGMKFYL